MIEITSTLLRLRLLMSLGTDCARTVLVWTPLEPFSVKTIRDCMSYPLRSGAYLVAGLAVALRGLRGVGFSSARIA